MTLHFAVVAREGVFVSVGDRLLTTGTAGSATPWDYLANKTLMVSGTGFNVAISYSGLAYVNGQPTDDWLASLITQEPMTIGPFGRQAIRIGSSRGPLALPEIVDRVISGLEGDLQRQEAPNRAMQVLVVGRSFQRRAKFGRGRIRPVGMRLDNSGRPGAKTKVHAASRELLLTEKFFLWSAGVNATLVRSRITDFLMQETVGTLIDLDTAIVDAIREVASTPTGDQVGDQCMSAIFWYDKVLLRFHRTADSPPARAFTPWVINNGSAFPPLEVGGGGGFWVAGFDLEVVPPFSDDEVPRGGYATGQLRRQWPE